MRFSYIFLSVVTCIRNRKPKKSKAKKGKYVIVWNAVNFYLKYTQAEGFHLQGTEELSHSRIASPS